MTSCVSVKFSTPQPADTAEMTSFPKSWRGRYVTMTDDTLFIGHNRLVFKDSLKEETYIIGQKIVLKKSDKYLVLNVKNEQNWDVVLAEKKRSLKSIYFLLLLLSKKLNNLVVFSVNMDTFELGNIFPSDDSEYFKPLFIGDFGMEKVGKLLDFLNFRCIDYR